MNEATLRGRLVDEGLSVSAWANDPGDRYPEHRHDYDKVLVAAAGSITFHLTEPEWDVVLAAGDRLHLPASTLHGASVGSSGVSCLEAHLPAGSLGPTARLIDGWAVEDLERLR